MTNLLGKSEQFAPFSSSRGPGEEERPSRAWLGRTEARGWGQRRGVWGVDPCWAGLSPSWQQLRQACSRPRPTVTSCSHRETHRILCHHLACQGAICVLILPTDPRHPLWHFSFRHSKHPASGTSSISHVSLVTFTLEHSSSLKKKKNLLQYCVSEE